MIFDESVTLAFEVIRAAYCFDAFTPVPHPDNIRFRADEERKVMHRLGLMLPGLTNDPDSQWAGQIVLQYFWKEIGLKQPPAALEVVPRFLLPPDHPLEPRIDLAELVRQMKQVPLPKQETICIVSSKLTSLQKLLNLSDVQTKFLKLVYISHFHPDLHGHARFSLQAALQHIEIRDGMHCNAVIAALIDEPVAAVEVMFAPPMSLMALRFLDSGFNERQRNLQNVLVDSQLDSLKAI